MSIQSWALNKLRVSGFDVTGVGTHGISVRVGRTERLIVVGEPGPEPFDRDELAHLMATYPSCEGVLLIRRVPTQSAFEMAAEQGLLIDTFGAFTSALSEREPLVRYQSSEEQYLRSRVQRHRSVVDMLRTGLSSWRIERNLPQHELAIITHDRYEFPVDELRQALSMHPGLAPDAVIITNPNTQGLSTRVLGAASELGVAIFLLNDFLIQLDEL
jgi:hypothetical protein